MVGIALANVLRRCRDNLRKGLASLATGAAKASEYVEIGGLGREVDKLAAAISFSRSVI